MSAIAGAGFVPSGVPVADQAPLSCTTANFDVVANAGPNGNFPVNKPCDSLDATQGQCSEYYYTVTSPTSATISQSILTISANQEIYDVDATGANPSVPGTLGDGDSKTGVLEHVKHDYPIRMNAQGDTVEARILIKGISSPKHSTMVVTGGKITESCIIAGPGVPGDVFAQTSMSKEVVAAGGKCPAKLFTNPKGEVINIKLYNDGGPLARAYPLLAAQNEANGCVADQPAPPEPGMKFKLALGGNLNVPKQPVQDLPGGKDGVTFGTGTTTVYLPSGWAICTETPCPGKTT
jgi:hypothetical protein